MDNQSSLGFDSDESDLDVQAESYDDGTIEDDFSKNFDFFVAEDKKITEQPDEPLSAHWFYHTKDRVLPPPPITREGCQAMVRVALRDGVKWVITKFVEEHNHKLMSPSKVPWRGSGKLFVSENCDLIEVIGIAKFFDADEKDKRIRELSLELYNERQKCKRRCAAYEEQLNTILKDLENHTEHISNKVVDIVQSIREIEELSEDSDSE
ncbi:hypothetical protein Patl1_26379 [Pistacia atlantica]|uniref:Uncharacterized protein n=1 Tax=Pistacia atlantica TaxID=434234 RepID=A0ACC1B438_9ROSI|nr:hypothetical protein Patl1_26379 [Pistacia atlantica]